MNYYSSSDEDIYMEHCYSCGDTVIDDECYNCGYLCHSCLKRDFHGKCVKCDILLCGENILVCEKCNVCACINCNLERNKCSKNGSITCDKCDHKYKKEEIVLSLENPDLKYCSECCYECKKCERIFLRNILNDEFEQKNNICRKCHLLLILLKVPLKNGFFMYKDVCKLILEYLNDEIIPFA